MYRSTVFFQEEGDAVLQLARMPSGCAELCWVFHGNCLMTLGCLETWNLIPSHGFFDGYGSEVFSIVPILEDGTSSQLETESHGKHVLEKKNQLSQAEKTGDCRWIYITLHLIDLSIFE